ncbi:MAG: hypothetical protein ACE5KM_23260 [Planctomycetaceae bacterium]
MKKLARTLLLLTLVAVVAAPAMAADGKKKKKRKKRPRRARIQALNLPKKLRQSLSDEQKKKIAAIRKEYTPKFQALNKKRIEIVSRERLREANKARQQARKDGKKGRALFKAFQEALGLTAQQKEKWQALQKEQRSLSREVRAKIADLLDDEQKKLLRPTRKKGKKKRKKKKDAAE